MVEVAVVNAYILYGNHTDAHRSCHPRIFGGSWLWPCVKSSVWSCHIFFDDRGETKPWSDGSHYPHIRKYNSMGSWGYTRPLLVLQKRANIRSKYSDTLFKATYAENASFTKLGAFLKCHVCSIDWKTNCSSDIKP